MISRPRLGQLVQCWYRAALRPIAQHHAKLGTVVVRARGPRQLNHGIRLEDGTLTIVPAGNLRNPPDLTLAPEPQSRLFQ